VVFDPELPTLLEKVIVDTDVGGDIDDAMCLAYLLAQPHCELLGVTTVSGEAERRAMIASALCHAAGKRVPIHVGASEPLRVKQRQPHAHQAARLGDWPHDRSFASPDAVGFTREMVRSNPGEITLLAVGPMTNVASLFVEDPAIPRLLKRLVLMAGWFGDLTGRGEVADWNVHCDPHAAEIVYRANVSAHRSVPLDVTQHAKVSVAWFRSRFRVGALRLVRDLAEGDTGREVWFHDPLTAATLFDDRICRFERGRVSVDLDAPNGRSRTSWQAGAGDHEVAVHADLNRFFDHYFSVVSS
jgi:inosine-uridine nucleoside N-ribohydrolase